MIQLLWVLVLPVIRSNKTFGERALACVSRVSGTWRIFQLPWWATQLTSSMASCSSSLVTARSMAIWTQCKDTAFVSWFRWTFPVSVSLRVDCWNAWFWFDKLQISVLRQTVWVARSHSLSCCHFSIVQMGANRSGRCDREGWLRALQCLGSWHETYLRSRRYCIFLNDQRRRQFRRTVYPEKCQQFVESPVFCWRLPFEKRWFILPDWQFVFLQPGDKHLVRIAFPICANLKGISQSRFLSSKGDTGCLFVCSVRIFCRRILQSSGQYKYLHSAVIVSGLMLVFGGNTHNDTSMSQGAKCYAADFLAYDMGELCSVCLK